MVANMGKIHRFRDARHLVDIAQEAIKIEIIADAAFVAFKVGHIHRVETNQGGPQTNIGLRQLVTGQEAVLAKDLFQTLQRCKYPIDRFVIGLLAGGESGFIDPVVDVVIDPAVQLINLRAQLRRVVIPSPSNAVFNMRMISADSLLTMVCCFLSHNTGTVTRPL